MHALAYVVREREKPETIVKQKQKKNNENIQFLKIRVFFIVDKSSIKFRWGDNNRRVNRSIYRNRKPQIPTKGLIFRFLCEIPRRIGLWKMRFMNLCAVNGTSAIRPLLFPFDCGATPRTPRLFYGKRRSIPLLSVRLFPSTAQPLVPPWFDFFRLSPLPFARCVRHAIYININFAQRVNLFTSYL